MKSVVAGLRSVRGRITLAATALVALSLVGASFAIVRLVENDLVASAEQALDDALEQAADVSGVSIDNRRFPVELDDPIPAHTALVAGSSQPSACAVRVSRLPGRPRCGRLSSIGPV